MQYRNKLFRWIIDDVAKLPEGSWLPWWAICLRCVMFPLRMVRAKWYACGYVREDYYTDVVYVGRRKVSRLALERFARENDLEGRRP